MIKQMKTKENYLEKIPCKNSSIKWSQDESGLVTLEVQNRGFANLLAQKLLKKPKVSFIHLEKFGSFIWTAIDGGRDIIAIGKLVKEQFGEKAEPLYERLSTYMKTLKSNGFIDFNK